MVYNFPSEAPEYKHPYGGVARDSYVTRAGFARFFERSIEYIDSLPVNQKIFDRHHPGVEMIGYKIQETKDGPIGYRITIINYRANAWPARTDSPAFRRDASL